MAGEELAGGFLDNTDRSRRQSGAMHAMSAIFPITVLPCPMKSGS